MDTSNDKGVRWALRSLDSAGPIVRPAVLVAYCSLSSDRLFCVATPHIQSSRLIRSSFELQIPELMGLLRSKEKTVATDLNAGTGLTSRRHFLKTGFLAVGSAFGWSLLGCNSELEIPCLGPARPPAQVAGMTYMWASKIGCALDCDLRNGRNKYHGGPATDDGALINAAMAGASANNPITLIIDGAALISGLFLPAGGYWSIAGLGCGTGFFVKSGSNNDAIHNGGPNAGVPSGQGPPAPSRGSNVSLSNFTVNGNQGDGFHGNSTTGMRQGTNLTWYFGINLMNLNNIRIENVVVVNTPAYHMRLSNVGNVSVSGCVMKSQGLSTDGLHFDGPANDITISNCDFTTGDDSIALNCPEGHTGDISRVAVSGCTFNSLSLMRLYTTNGYSRFSIDSVSVTNCRATLSEAAFLIGLTNGSLPHSIASLNVTDCSITAPAILAMAENFGTIVLNNVTFVPSTSNVVWVPPQTNHTCGFSRPSPLYGNVMSAGSSLSFQNCRVFLTADIDVAVLVLDNGSTIDTVSFNGFAVQASGSSSFMRNLVNIGVGSVGQLIVDELDSSNISDPVSQGGFSSIGSISGVGVLATGWEFPDALMADGVPYISANSGLPSIKVSGVVEPYTQP